MSDKLIRVTETPLLAYTTNLSEAPMMGQMRTEAWESGRVNVFLQLKDEYKGMVRDGKFVLSYYPTEYLPAVKPTKAADVEDHIVLGEN